MKVKYPYQLNIILSVLSIGIGIVYILVTVPIFIEYLKCATCKEMTMRTLHHYWYRWCLYALLVFAGYLLFSRLKGARRLYYIFFLGATAIAIHDIVKTYNIMDVYEITFNVTIPIAVSVLGTIYFLRYYKDSLKNR